MSKMNDYRVVIGIDFGTTYSGFAYAHKKSIQNIYTKADWDGQFGRFKTPTVLLYDDKYDKAESWGFPALATQPKSSKKKKSVAAVDRKPVELFKLHLGGMENKPPLPKGFDYKKAIIDYLHKMTELIKETIDGHWKIDFYTQALIVLTIPAEFDNTAMSIIRECAFKAGLLKDQYSRNLRFTTEPEAAAIHCMKSLKEHNLSVGSKFMVVDCGGGTVDLTTRELLKDEKLSEITERTGDYCGGSFVDQEFLKFMERKVGSAAINLTKENHYSQLQYMIQEFCKTKVRFTGVPSGFQSAEIDLEGVCPILKQHCKDEHFRNIMEEEEWIIDLNFEDVKAMFDPVVDRIIRLVESQLRSNSDCSALFLVGGFSESKYLQSRIKQAFGARVPLIVVPPHPVIAVIKGAVEYGLREEIVTTRVLKWTYGTDIARKWRPGDPENRRRSDGRIVKFERLAKRGTQLNVNEEMHSAFFACDAQENRMGLDLYITQEDDAEFCDDSHVRSLGKWSIELPRSENDDDRSILFTMVFGDVEIQVSAVNSGTNKSFKTRFDLDLM